MTFKALKKYGALRKVFRGTGTVRFSDGSDIRARFTLGQFTNTKLLVSADLGPQPLSFLSGLLSGRLEAQSLQGSLPDGRRLKATDLLIIENSYSLGSATARLIAIAADCTITGPNTDLASVVFDLVNLRIDPEMTIMLGSRQIQLRRIQNYDQAIAKLKAQSGVLVTCTATAIITAQSEIEEVVQVIDRLCDLMSVARATLVSWTSFEVCTADGVSPSSPYSRYRNSVTRPYTGFELVDGPDRQNTKRFLEEGFRRYEEHGEIFRFRKVARAFIETRDGPFAETRVLAIAVLVEYLVNVRARLGKRLYFFKSKRFDAAWKLFKGQARQALKDSSPDSADQDIDSMLANMKGQLNRRPLKDKLDDLADWLEISFTPDEIVNFIKVRNLLAHESRFPDNGKPEEHLRKMQHFLDRIILRLFGYRGAYLDSEHNGRRSI